MQPARDLTLKGRYSLSGGVVAGAIYVSPNGLDTNQGDLLRPVKTLDRAAALTSAGGTICYLQGTHYCAGQQTTSTNGTIGSRITIRPSPGQYAVIDGSGMPFDATPLVMLDGDYTTFQDLEVQNGGRQGIAVYQATGVTVLRCTVHGCWGTGMISEGTTSANNDGTTFDSCTVYRNTRHNLTGAAGYGQGVTMSIGRNGVVQNCYIYANMGEGLGLQKGHINPAVVGNRVGDNYKINIYNEDTNTSGTVINRNYCFATGLVDTLTYTTSLRPTGISFARETGSGHLDNRTIVNNIIVGCHYGMSFFVQVANSGLTNSIIAGNTIVNSVAAALSFEGGAAASNNQVLNNIFYNNNANPLWAGDMSGFFLDYNLCFGAPPAGGQNILTDPLFTNGSGSLIPAGDFVLGGSSPAIGAGTTVPSLTTDYFGDSRSGAQTIGATHTAGSAYTWPTPPTYTRTMFVAVQDAEVAALNNSTQMTLVSVKFQHDPSTDYWVIWSGDFQTPLTTNACRVGVVDNAGNVLDRFAYKPSDTAPLEWASISDGFKWTSPASTATVQFAVRVTAQLVGATMKARNGRIIVIKAVATDQAVVTATQVALTNVEATYQTLTWTPASTKDYLIVAGCLLGSTPNVPQTATARLYNNGTSQKVCETHAQPVANYDTNANIPALMVHYAAGLTAVSQTFTLRVIHTHATAGLIANPTIVALDVTGGVFYQNATVPVDGTTNTTSTFADSSTYTPTIAATKEHIVFFGGGWTSNSATVSGFIRSMVDGVEVAQAIRENGNAAQFMGAATVWTGSLSSGARVLKQQVANESGTVTVGSKTTKIVAWQIGA